MELTDEQWKVLAPLIPEARRRDDGKGRPRRQAIEVLEGICWVLRTGAQWTDLPERYPPYQTCHRRFQEWVQSGVLQQVLETLAQDLEERGELDFSECFIDGTFVVAKKGAQAWVRLNGARVAKSWQYQTLLVLASPCTLRLLHQHRGQRPGPLGLLYTRSRWYARLSHLDTSTHLPKN